MLRFVMNKLLTRALHWLEEEEDKEHQTGTTQYAYDYYHSSTSVQIEEQLVIILFSNEQSDFAIEQSKTLYLFFSAVDIVSLRCVEKIAVKAVEL